MNDSASAVAYINKENKTNSFPTTRLSPDFTKWPDRKLYSPSDHVMEDNPSNTKNGQSQTDESASSTTLPNQQKKTRLSPDFSKWPNTKLYCPSEHPVKNADSKEKKMTYTTNSRLVADALVTDTDIAITRNPPKNLSKNENENTKIRRNVIKPPSNEPISTITTTTTATVVTPIQQTTIESPIATSPDCGEKALAAMIVNCLKSGPLITKRRYTRRYRTTVFVLEGATLNYLSAKGKVKKIPLQKSLITDLGKANANFQIRVKDRTYELEAPDVNVKRDWLSIFKVVQQKPHKPRVKKKRHSAAF